MTVVIVSASNAADLGSWNDGPTKPAIVGFVKAAMSGGLRNGVIMPHSEYGCHITQLFRVTAAFRARDRRSAWPGPSASH